MRFVCDSLEGVEIGGRFENCQEVAGGRFVELFERGFLSNYRDNIDIDSKRKESEELRTLPAHDVLASYIFLGTPLSRAIRDNIPPPRHVVLNVRLVAESHASRSEIGV